MQKLLDRDCLTALLLLFVGTVALVQSGDDVMNWVFPRLAAYVVLAIAAVLLVRVLFGETLKRSPDIITMSAEDRIVFVDVVLFLLIVLGYLFLMYGLGFWVASFLMLSLASTYLTLDKTPRNLALAVVVPLAACIMAYIIFLHVFYVPLPEAGWFEAFGS